MDGFEMVKDVVGKVEAMDKFFQEDFQLMKKSKFKDDDFRDGVFRVYRLAIELKLATDELGLLHPDIA